MSTGSPAPVTIVGALPPPLQGAAQVTAWLTVALRDRAPVVNLDTAPSGFTRGPLYHARRLARVLAAVARLAGGGFGARGGAVYLSAAGGGAVFYDILAAAAARLLHRPFFIHHHSFAYVDRRDWRRALLARVAGPACRHICLCPRMAETLARTYPAVRHTLVLPNAAFQAPGPAPGRKGARGERAPEGLHLGFLSNLSRDKGLDLVIDTFAAAGATASRLVLAGAPLDGDGAALCDAAARRFGAGLDARGPVAGADKARFFEDIDVFLFPTRYANEAEPLVVIEALAAGVPVIAHGRGCIPHMIPAAAGLVIAPGDDFAGRAAALIAAWAGDRAHLQAASAAAREGAAEAHARARPMLEALLIEMTGLPAPGGEAIGAAQPKE